MVTVEYTVKGLNWISRSNVGGDSNPGPTPLLIHRNANYGITTEMPTMASRRRDAIVGISVYQQKQCTTYLEAKYIKSMFTCSKVNLTALS